eukprot:1323843-Rhodomonas_salina.1
MSRHASSSSSPPSSRKADVHAVFFFRANAKRAADAGRPRHVHRNRQAGARQDRAAHAAALSLEEQDRG